MSTNVTVAQPAPRKVKDAQTGKDFDLIPEGRLDVLFAWISAAYSIAVILYLTYVVLDMLYGQAATVAAAAAAGTPAPAPPSMSLPVRLLPVLNVPASKLIFYTAVGGAIGASVNNLRSFITWHAEERAFGWRFIWKYLAMPPLGGTLAVLVYGILQGGMAVFTGGSAPTGNQVTSLSAWATGTLAGYGAHKVFKWLDDKVNSLFKVEAAQTTVPDVKGQSPDQARKMLTDAQLEVGTVSEAPASSDQVGKVIAQAPAAGIQSECGRKVDLTVGIASPDTIVDPDVTDLTAKAPGSNGTAKKDETAGAATGTSSTETVAADSTVIVGTQKVEG